jgi:hypothetical protein
MLQVDLGLNGWGEMEKFKQKRRAVDELTKKYIGRKMNSNARRYATWRTSGIQGMTLNESLALWLLRRHDSKDVKKEEFPRLALGWIGLVLAVQAQ